MPTLKQITTSIELGSSDTRIREYDHRFTDGSVECFIVAPETNIPFHVRITTSGYIAPGLAAYVFIDGEYQCNRNRLCLEVPANDVDPAEYEIDFKLRQKEEKTSDGYFVVRDWFFTPLKTGVADGEPNMSRDWAKNVGTIEVVILRCKQGGEKETATDPAETVVATAPSAGRDMLQALSAKSKPAKQSAENTWNAFKENNTPKAPKENKTKGWKQDTPKAPSRVSSKKGSVVESLGGMGMFGMFDGAGDDPGYYRKFRPKNIVGQTPLPGHRFDDSTGRYRYYEDDDPFVRDDRRSSDDTRTREDRDHSRHQSESRYRPYTYTVGGGFDDDDRTPSTRSGPKRAVPRTSPSPTTDQRTRRRGVEFEIPTRSSSRHHPTHREQSRGEPQERRPSLPRISVFIQEASDRMYFLQYTAIEQAAKYEALWDETNECESDLVYQGMLTTLKRKYGEIQSILAELRDLHDVVKACMEDMDRMEWKQTYDLLFEKGLLPSPKIDLSLPEGKKPNEESHDDQKQGEAPKDNGWQEVGEGKSNEKKDEGNNNTWSGDNQNAQTEQVTDTWANNDTKSESKKSASWGADNNKDQDNHDNQGGGGWGDDDNASKKDAGGEGWDNDNKDPWDKKSEKPKARSQAASHRPKSTISSTSDREPHAEMKSYWKEWSKRPSTAPKLRIPFRDPYKYPAPPTRPLPPSRAKDINHGVQTGRGADYAHKHYRPEYLDTMEKPYAVFTFKYRSQAALEKVLKKKLDVGYVEEAVKGAEMERLMRTPKDELVAELLRKRGVPTGGGSRVSAAAEIKAASEKKRAKSKSGGSNKGDGGWDDSPAAAAPAGDDAWGQESDKGKSRNGWNSTKEVTPKDSVSQAGWGKAASAASDHQHWGNNEPGMKTTKPPAGEPSGGAAGW